jgi:hypothetical protein
MALDIQPITGTPAKVATRLCNFVTADSSLLRTHQEWLDANLRPIALSLHRPWVDLLGYASRRGDFEFNRQLSFRRCQAVKSWIGQYSDRLSFQIEWAKGESESDSTEENDDGYWRAVEVYVYGGFSPKPPAPDGTRSGSTQFSVRMLQGLSASIPGIDGPQVDAFMFELVDRTNGLSATFKYTGGSLALPSLFPLSITNSGPYVPFTTTRAVDLRDFGGRARLFQDPGAAVGKWSIGSTRVAFESQLLLSKGAGVVPSIIEVPSNQSIQLPGLGSAGVGQLTLFSDVTRLDQN